MAESGDFGEKVIGGDSNFPRLLEIAFPVKAVEKPVAGPEAGKKGGRTEMLKTETPKEEYSAERRNLVGLGKFAAIIIRTRVAIQAAMPRILFGGSFSDLDNRWDARAPS